MLLDKKEFDGTVFFGTTIISNPHFIIYLKLEGNNYRATIPNDLYKCLIKNKPIEISHYTFKNIKYLRHIKQGNCKAFYFKVRLVKND